MMSKSFYKSVLNSKVILCLLLFILAGFVYSCKKESYSERKVSFEELNKLYAKASTKINELKKEKQNRTFTLMSNTPSNTYGNDTMVSTILTEEEAKEILEPLMEPTITYLQQNYDINLYDYLSPNDPNIAIVGSAALRLDALEQANLYVDTTNINLTNLNGGLLSFANNGNQLIETSNLDITLASSFMVTTSEANPGLYDCALRAIGIEAVVKLFNGGVTAATKLAIRKKALRKVITKVATRTLGVIGAAIAVYEFGDCMEWW